MDQQITNKETLYNLNVTYNNLTNLTNNNICT